MRKGPGSDKLLYIRFSQFSDKAHYKLQGRRRRRNTGIDQVWRIGVSKAGGFIVAKVILGVLASIVLSVSFLLIGLPSPIALGVAAGILSQLIPVVGTFLGGLVPFIASISLGTNAMISTVVVLLAYQIIENYFISPRVLNNPCPAKTTLEPTVLP